MLSNEFFYSQNAALPRPCSWFQEGFTAGRGKKREGKAEVKRGKRGRKRRREMT